MKLNRTTGFSVLHDFILNSIFVHLKKLFKIQKPSTRLFAMQKNTTAFGIDYSILKRTNHLMIWKKIGITIIKLWYKVGNKERNKKKILNHYKTLVSLFFHIKIKK